MTIQTGPTARGITSPFSTDWGGAAVIVNDLGFWRRRPQPHDPVVKGTGKRAKAICYQCTAGNPWQTLGHTPEGTPLLYRMVGGVVASGSRSHVNREARLHREAHR